MESTTAVSNSPINPYIPVSVDDLIDKAEKAPTWVTIGAKLAEEILSTRNVRNRPVDKRHAQKLAEAITAGEYMANGDTVRFYDDRALADGQHRLHAVVAAGKAITALAVAGIPVDAQNTLDQGRKGRTAANALAMVGVHDADLTASTCKTVMVMLEAKKLRGPVPSTLRVSNFAKANGSQLQAAVGFAMKMMETYNQPILSTSETAVVHYLATRKGLDMARVEAALEVITSGITENLKGDPCAPMLLECFRMFEKSKAARAKQKDHLPAARRYEILDECLGYFLAGQPAARLGAKKKVPNATFLPTLIGAE